MKGKKMAALALAALFLTGAVGCSGGQTEPSAEGTGSANEKQEIVFADVGWDSIRLHNAVAGLVAEHVFGYSWVEVPGSTPISHEALMKGEIDVHMEEWTDNLPDYQGDLEAGKFQELGINYDDNAQAFYIPKYVADANPDLKTVKDLANHAELFPDPEDSAKAVIYGGIPGWSITEIMQKKVEAYGLSDRYNYVAPGSQAAMDATVVSALDKQENIVFYYWEPTWLMGKYDFVLLEDEPYNADTFQQGIGACPSVKVTVAVSNAFAQSNPAFCEFLSKYHTSSALTNEGLAHMQETKEDFVTTAKWLLNQHPELIDQWLNEDQAEQLLAAL